MDTRIKVVGQWTKRVVRQIHYGSVIFAVLATTLAFLLRISLRDFWSQDANTMTAWYLGIRADGIKALGQNITNYPPLYVYIILLISRVFPHLWSLVAMKLPGIACDFLCAWLIYKLVRIRYPDGPIALFAYVAMLFAPTVVLNSSAWGQVDIFYTTGLVACIYFFLKEKSWLACLAFGVAISLKFQAVFLAPFLLVLLFKRKVKWTELLIIPGVYLVTIIPAWLAGRPLLGLLTIYVSQVNQFPELALNVPNMYAWLPSNNFNIFYPAGLLLGGGICLIYFFIAHKSPAHLDGPLIVQLALVSVLIVPFFLPLMHDRYFFPADVLSIVYGFYFPKYFYIPIVVSLVSFAAYQLFLFGLIILPLSIWALVELGVIIFVVQKMILALYRPEESPEPELP
jgi:Gpi18-like mannosyltransferase